TSGSSATQPGRRASAASSSTAGAKALASATPVNRSSVSHLFRESAICSATSPQPARTRHITESESGLRASGSMILKDFPEGLWKILQDHGSSRWDSSNPIIMMRGGASDDWICGRIQDMAGDLDKGYLAGLTEGKRAELERVNAPGLAALRDYLKSGEAVAF